VPATSEASWQDRRRDGRARGLPRRAPGPAACAGGGVAIGAAGTRCGRSSPAGSRARRNEPWQRSRSACPCLLSFGRKLQRFGSLGYPTGKIPDVTKVTGRCSLQKSEFFPSASPARLRWLVGNNAKTPSKFNEETPIAAASALPAASARGDKRSG